MTNAKPPRRGVPQPLQGGPLRFGPFWLEARLAVGGTSEVYLAKPADGGRSPREAHRQAPAAAPGGRFRRADDVRARGRAARRSHPRERRVASSGRGSRPQGEPYLAMEYVDGCDTFRLLRAPVQERRTCRWASASTSRARCSRRSPRRTRRATRRASRSASSTATSRRRTSICARTGEVKLGDFGIARSATRPPMVRASGELRRRRPRRWGSSRICRPSRSRASRSTIGRTSSAWRPSSPRWSSGKPLFPGTGQLQILLAIRDCRLDPLEKASASLPPGLVPVLQKALSRDPGKRYQDAPPLSAALAPFLVEDRMGPKELAARVAAVRNRCHPRRSSPPFERAREPCVQSDRTRP